MEEQTCMEYLFLCVQSNHTKDINQNILFNASNEFRNLWNLVKKLRDLARVDVQKITRFLDAVQEALEKNHWNGAARHCSPAEHEYKQIRRYIRPSFLEDFKVARFIENVDPSVKSKSGTRREKKPSTSSGNQHRRQNFRNRQINKQKDTQEKESDIKNNDNAVKDIKQQNETDEKGNAVKLIDKDKRNVATNHTKLKHAKNDNFTERQTDAEVNSNFVIKGEQEKERDDKGQTVNIVDKEREHVPENDKYIEKHSEAEANLPSAAKNETTNKYNSEHRLSEKTVLQNSDVIETHINNTLEIDKSRDNKGETDTDGDNRNKCEDVVSVNKDSTDRKDSENNLERDGLEATVSTRQNTTPEETKTEDNNQSIKDDGKNTPDTKQSEAQNEDHLDDLKASENQRNQNAVAVNSRHIEFSSLVSERMTEVSFESNTDEIVVELRTIYETDWSIAYKALTGCNPSNGKKNTIDFLGEIVKLAAQKVHTIPGKCSTHLTEDQTVTESLRKLKEEFLRRHLKELQAEHSIDYINNRDGEYNVNIYSAKCVELAWFMFTRQPPMVFDYDSRPMLLEDLYDIFKPYKNSGNCIHYVVWPAIRRCLGGEVVAYGIADFR